MVIDKKRTHTHTELGPEGKVLALHATMATTTLLQISGSLCTADEPTPIK